MFEEIENGLYIIKNKANLNLCLKNSSLYFTSEESCHFLFHKKDTKPQNEYDFVPEDKNIYYFIEDELTGNKLYFDEISKSLFVSKEINATKDNSNYLWELLPKKEKNTNSIYYEIKSKLKKYFISYEDSEKKTSKAFCESSWTSLTEDRDTKMKLVQLYHENENKKESKILEKEPIDVVIKYIDLNDETLDRKNLEQSEKDKHNNELKYSLRSIFKNIPWIRKIFIIMPNQKIDFLKDREEIKDKIEYIQDSTLLGFDSSSPPAFQFNLHKLKQYNLSENFILMDDDYFIAQPLKKSDLFYELNGKVYPYIISTKYYIIDPDELKTKYMNGMNQIDEIKYNSEEGFEFRKISTLNFLYNIFDDNYDTNNLIGVGYTHNAIPLKISDLEEVYNNIENNYKYSEICLRGNKRFLHNLQPQILFMNYAKNKYNRYVNKIDWKYFDLADVDKVNLESKLFVLNREDKEYNNDIFKKEAEILEKLFPEKINYEKDLTRQNEEKNNVQITNTIIETNKIEKEEKNKENEEKEIDKKDENNNSDNIENKETERIEENEKEKQKEEIKEVIQSQDNNKILEKKIKSLEKEISNQKNENKENFEKLLEEIKTIKNDVRKNSTYNELLASKIQTLSNTQKELNERLSTQEKENKELKKIQTNLSEKFEKKESNQGNNEIDYNSLKQIFNEIKEKNTKLENQIDNLSEEKNSLITKVNSMQTSISNKENQLSKLTEENNNLKSQLKELLTQFESMGKHLDNLDSLEGLLEQNEEKVASLRNEITQIKQSLEQNKKEDQKDLKINEDKDKKDNSSKEVYDYTFSYVLILLFICVVAIYIIYKVFFGKDDVDPKKIRHMKLSSHSGYGSISSTSFM